MEREALIAAIKDSISDVLEKMFFLPLDFFDTASPEEFVADEMVVSKLSFTGPFTGYFLLSIPKRYNLSLAANFLGENKENISQDQANEIVKEAVNMLAATTFFYYDDQVVFGLGIPEFIPSAQLQRGYFNYEKDIFIGIDTLECRLGLYMIINS